MSDEGKTLDSPSDDPLAEILGVVPENLRTGSAVDSVKKLADSYAEARKTISSKYQEMELELKNRPQVTKFETRESVLEAAGVDMNTLSQEWVSNDGKLSPETYEKFEKLGVPKFTVDSLGYIESQQAALLNETIYAAGGGEESTRALIEWAKNNAPEPLKAKYSEAYESRNIAEARKATAELVAAYEQANGTVGSGEIRGGSVPLGKATAFTSYSEKVAASRKFGAGEMSESEYERRLRATQESNPSAMRPPVARNPF